jgi:hypothetical protein
MDNNEMLESLRQHGFIHIVAGYDNWYEFFSYKKDCCYSTDDLNNWRKDNKEIGLMVSEDGIINTENLTAVYNHFTSAMKLLCNIGCHDFSSILPH